MKNLWGKSLLGVLTLLVAAVPVLASNQAPAQRLPTPAPSQATLEHEVRHELVMLPYYSVFDNLEYQVKGTRVVLTGQVLWPTLKSDAEAAVRDIPGVTAVVNHIQVLPVSTFDNSLRFRVLRAVYGTDSMYRYALPPIPSIHIIVDNGNVTLVGAVANKMDREIAYLQAMSVPGVFSVKNELRVD